MSQQDYFVEFAKELGKLNGNIESVLERLEKGDEKMAKHEARLTLLEDRRRKDSREEHGQLPRWAVYLLLGLLSALLGALGVKIPSVM